jgi:hypothetical protein
MSNIGMTYFLAREVLALREISKQTEELEHLAGDFDQLLLTIFSLEQQTLDCQLKPSTDP